MIRAGTDDDNSHRDNCHKPFEHTVRQVVTSSESSEMTEHTVITVTAVRVITKTHDVLVTATVVTVTIVIVCPGPNSEIVPM